MRTVSAQPAGLRKCKIRSVITLFRKRRFSGGLGGVGTSTLAIQYAWENHERYEGVWWLGAETKASIVDGLVADVNRLRRHNRLRLQPVERIRTIMPRPCSLP